MCKSRLVSGFPGSSSRGEKSTKNFLAHACDLLRTLVVFKVDNAVRAAGFVFNVQLTVGFPDRLDRLRLDVVIAAWHAKDVPGDALAVYVLAIGKPGVMQAVDQTHIPVVFWPVEPTVGRG